MGVDVIVYLSVKDGPRRSMGKNWLGRLEGFTFYHWLWIVQHVLHITVLLLVFSTVCTRFEIACRDFRMISPPVSLHDVEFISLPTSCALVSLDLQPMRVWERSGE